MNFVPGFAPDARSQWLELPPVLQELVLDEMERLADSPPHDEFFRTDFVHTDKDGGHYVFLQGIIDRTRNRLTITGVNYHFRPHSP